MYVVIWKESPRISIQFDEGLDNHDGIFDTYEAAEKFAKNWVWEGAVCYIARIAAEVTLPRCVKVKSV